jgi:hypothetical protein
MAHGIESVEMLKLHQVLHGYVDGHRQLAASLVLKQRDLRTMLVLSDISGTGARIGEEGYLTGYPLVESGVYALARTWAAPEMSRPGCVWTHTLLIDFVDLATLDSMENILSFFRRPQPELLSEYEKPLKVTYQSTFLPLSDELQEWNRLVLASLYGNPSSSVIVARPTEIDVDRVLLAVWSQQWPRLRRSFRFCSLSAADRSFEGNRFDLQILPSSDRSIRSRFPGTLDAENVKSLYETWIDDAIMDLVQPDASGLRSFIRHIGADVATGRDVFRSLCRLHRLVSEFKSSPKFIEDAIKLLQNELGSVQARAARSIVAEAVLDQSDEPSDTAIKFLINNLQFIDLDMYTKRANRISCILWNSDPVQLITMINEGGPFSREPQLAFESLSVDELVSGLLRAPTLEQVVLNYRPDILAEPNFWSRNSLKIDIVFTVINRSSISHLSVISAIIEAKRDDLATRVVHEFGSFLVLQAVDSKLASNWQPKELDRWILASVCAPPEVAKYLACGPVKSQSLLVAIAKAMPPYSVPNEFGTDPWLIANSKVFGKVSAVNEIFLNAYFLSRAFSSSSRNSAELARLGFDVLHATAAANHLPDDAWLLLEPYLPLSSSFWFDWDRCQRLRAGIVNLFIENDLAPQEFAIVTTNDKLFAELAATAAKVRKGRKYLMRVLNSIKSMSDANLLARIWIIKKLLG